MKNHVNMPFGRKNYMIMLLGIAVLLLGFIVMSIDGEEFGFGFLGITLGPFLLLVGFAIQFWAIFFYDDNANSTSEMVGAESNTESQVKAGKRKK